MHTHAHTTTYRHQVHSVLVRLTAQGAGHVSSDYASVAFATLRGESRPGPRASILTKLLCIQRLLEYHMGSSRK